MAKGQGPQAKAGGRAGVAALAFAALLLVGPASALTAATSPMGGDLVLADFEVRALVGASLELGGNITIGRGASLSIDASSVRLTGAGATVSLGPQAKLELLNGSGLSSLAGFDLVLWPGARLLADRSLVEGATTFLAHDAEIVLNLSTISKGGPIELRGSSSLVSANSSFLNLQPVGLELADRATAEVRGLTPPAYSVGPTSRVVLATFASVEVRDASGKVLAGVDWQVESNGTALAGSGAFGGREPLTRLNHRGFAEPQWVAVPQLVDQGGSVTRPSAQALASYGGWNGVAALNTSRVTTALFVATPTGFVLEDRSDWAGLDAGRGWMPGDPSLSQGPGAAWADFDGDGVVDVVVTAAPEAEAVPLAARGLTVEDAPAPVLFLGRGDGTFRQANATGLEAAHGATGLASADFDNDGDSDLFVARYGAAGWLTVGDAPGDYTYHEGKGLGGLLLRNDGRLRFADVTGPAGISLGGRHTVGGAWGDFNRDGCIDLFALNMGEILFPPPAPSGSSAASFADNLIRNESDSLWKNNCDGTFVDVTQAAGHVTGGGEPGAVGDLQRLVRVAQEEYFVGNRSGLTEEGSGISYAALWLDTEGDGDLDLFVADDFGASPLYINRGDGTFELGTASAGLLKVGSAMSFTAADFDLDGDLDIFQTNFNRDFLWIANGNGTYQERSEAWGVPEVAVGWGARAEDLNLDGYPDLAIATGAMSMGLKASDRSVLYRNEAGRRFVDVSAASGFDGPGIAISLSSGDANRDGRSDLLLGRINASNTFLINREPGGGSVVLSLWGTTSPTFGEGAQVTATISGKPARFAFAPGGEYASSSQASLIIGLGGAPSAQRVTVWWPSGTVQALGDLVAGQFVQAFEPTDAVADAGPDRAVSAGASLHLQGRVTGLPRGSYTMGWRIESGGQATQRLADGANLSGLLPGSYLSLLEVTGRWGEVLASDSARIEVVDIDRPAPEARAVLLDAGRRAIKLSAAGSRDGDPRLFWNGAFHWVLKQGEARVAAEGPEVDLVLPSGGLWTVNLTVVDPSGNEAALSFAFDLGAEAGPPASAVAMVLAILGGAGLVWTLWGLKARRARAARPPPLPERPQGHAPARAARKAHPKARLR